ncbi:MAG TPA: hypothetical protein VJ725_32965, partial [Thermoanaerobaculia bacterium]|nr:hypothetical protein [Thermoanaerobaculia bacterium]
MLEEAVRLSPHDARLRSDLAAAYLAHAQERGEPTSLLPALATAQRAVDLDGRLPEARFNHALALEKLYLPAAKKAWRDYLRLDSTSEWADEALGHFAGLVLQQPADLWSEQKPQLLAAGERGDFSTVRELVERFQEPVRAFAEQELLALWADHQAAGRSEDAARTLRAVRTIGRALAVVGGDSLLEESAAVIEAAVADGEHSDRVRALVEGHRAYKEGLALLTARRTATAATRFQHASQLLRSAKSPFAALAELSLSTCRYRSRDLSAALDLLDLLARDPHNGSFPNLLGRVFWLAGLVRGSSGDATGCLTLYREALSQFERTGEEGRIGALHNRIAEQLRLLGDSRKAWRSLYSALGATVRLRDFQALQPLWLEAAEGALELGELESAMVFQDEAVRGALASGRPEDVAFALLRRSPLQYRLGREDEAVRDLSQAREALAKVGDESFRRPMWAQFLQAEAELSLTSDPDQALRQLDEALAYYGDSAPGAVLSDLYRSRARAWLARGEEALAEKELRFGIRAIERQRQNVEEEDLRISYLDD